MPIAEAAILPAVGSFDVVLRIASQPKTRGEQQKKPSRPRHPGCDVQQPLIQIIVVQVMIGLSDAQLQIVMTTLPCAVEKRSFLAHRRHAGLRGAVISPTTMSAML
jgi:hypothetical protein